MSQTLAAVLAAAALLGGPLLALGMGLWGERTELAADEQDRQQARSCTPSSGSTIAGHTHPQSVSGRTGVEQPPALAAPPVPPTSAGVDAAPLSTSADLDFPPSPQASAGTGSGSPQPVPCACRATAPVGGAPAVRCSPPTGHHPGARHD